MRKKEMLTNDLVSNEMLTCWLVNRRHFLSQRLSNVLGVIIWPGGFANSVRSTHCTVIFFQLLLLLIVPLGICSFLFLLHLTWKKKEKGNSYCNNNNHSIVCYSKCFVSAVQFDTCVLCGLWQLTAGHILRHHHCELNSTDIYDIPITFCIYI